MSSEIAILSALINRNDFIDDIEGVLQPHHFLDEWCKRLYQTAVQQIRAGGCDVVTLAQALPDIDPADIHDVIECPFGALQSHMKKLVDGYKGRRLFALSETLQTLTFSDAPIQSRIDLAMTELTNLNDVEAGDDWVDAYTAAMQHTDLLEARHEGLLQGMKTGLQDLDEMLDGGIHRKSLFVIGARPAMGKTALGMTIGLSMARDYAVGFLSMEMPHQDVRDRQIAILSSQRMSHIKRPKSGLDYSEVLEGVEKSRTLKWFVSDRPGLNVLQVKAKARQLKRKRGLDVLIVDYLGLMSGLDQKQPRHYQIEEMTKGLKILAKELDIAVICLAQVRRDAANTVPGLSDLKDSGAIEQDADVVAFIHRPIAADPQLPEPFKNYAQLRLAKNRQGRTGDIHLFYHGEYTRFDAWGGEPPKMVKSVNKFSGDF